MVIVLFGSTGMLGRYVLKVLREKYEVICILRNDYDIENDNQSKLELQLNQILQKNDIIINCAGIIPQKYTNDKFKTFIKINTLFPRKLNDISIKNGYMFIHITTDCVFSGLKGKYTEDDKHDCVDEYGKSKSLGENTNIMNIRTSIIGDENFNKKSLITWIISNSGKEIDGYTNHLWNGVTCLELCILIENIIKEKLYWKGIRHIFSPNTVSKSQLISIINEVYELGITINDKETEVKCFRNLDTIKDDGMIYKDIRSQIIDLKKFKL